MNIRAVFKDSLTYPFRDIKQFIILFILVLGAYIIYVPIILVFGYLYRIIQRTLQGSDEVPDFEELKEISINGLRYLGLYIILYIIPIFIVSMAIMSSNMPILILNSLVNKIIFLIVGFLINIVLIMALANLVHENNFKSAFDFKKIFELIKKITWKKYLACLVIYTMVVELLVLLISVFSVYMVYFGTSYTSITLINAVLLLILVLFYTYTYMFMSRLVGLIYPLKAEKENKAKMDH
jgi:hypothetical protein